MSGYNTKRKGPNEEHGKANQRETGRALFTTPFPVIGGCVERGVVGAWGVRLWGVHWELRLEKLINWCIKCLFGCCQEREVNRKVCYYNVTFFSILCRPARAQGRKNYSQRNKTQHLLFETLRTLSIKHRQLPILLLLTQH